MLLFGCGGDPLRKNSGVIIDDDDDGVPDDLDKCPGVYGESLDPEKIGCPVERFNGDDVMVDSNITTPDSYPVTDAQTSSTDSQVDLNKTEIPVNPDSDGDGIPDNLDQCPFEFHMTANGCPADLPDVVISDADVFILDGSSNADSTGFENNPRLQFLWQNSVAQNTNASCVHASVSDSSGLIAWQEGAKLLVAPFDISDGTIGLMVQGSTGLSDQVLSMCNMGQSLAFSGDRFGIIWPQVTNGNVVNLEFSTLDATGKSLSAPLEVDSYPKPNLGFANQNWIAGLSVLGDSYFIAAWADRDRLEAVRILQDGTKEGDSFILNNFPGSVDPLTLQVINPQISAAGDIYTAIWQEGYEKGRIIIAEFDAQNDQVIAHGKLENSDYLKWPSVASGSSINAYSYVDENGLGKLFLQNKKATFGVPATSPNFTIYPPHLVQDTVGRLSLAWLAQVPPDEPQVYLLGLGDQSSFIEGMHYDGVVIGGANDGDHMALATNGNIVVAGFVHEGEVILKAYSWSE